MRRVLIVTYGFPPLGGGGVQRPLKLAKYLPQHGWLPVILTVRESESTSQLRDDSLAADLPACVRIIRVSSPLEKLWSKRMLPGRLGPYLNIPDERWTWSVRALCRARGLARRGEVDAVVTTSPPNSAHLVGYWLRKWYRIPWIADFRDPWTRNPFYEEMTSRLQRPLDQYWERKVLRAADHVTITTYDIDHHFPQDARPPLVTTLLNGHDEADFREMDGHARPGPPFQIAYVGRLYDDSVTRVFLEGFETFVRATGLAKGTIELVLAGDTGGSSVALPMSLVPYVRLLGYVPHAESIRTMISSHLLVLLTRWGSSNPSYDCQIPGKAYEYLRTGRPILHVAPKPCFMSHLIDVLGAGTNAYTTEATARGLAETYNRWQQGTLAGRKADLKALDPFARDRQAGVLADILNATMSRTAETHPQFQGGGEIAHERHLSFDVRSSAKGVELVD